MYTLTLFCFDSTLLTLDTVKLIHLGPPLCPQVKMTEAKGYPTTRRISLSLAAINRAARVVVLVAGKAKQGIMRELGDSPKADVAKWPVTGVQSPVWYVDSDAMAI